MYSIFNDSCSLSISFDIYIIFFSPNLEVDIFILTVSHLSIGIDLGFNGVMNPYSNLIFISSIPFSYFYLKKNESNINFILFSGLNAKNYPSILLIKIILLIISLNFFSLNINSILFSFLLCFSSLDIE
jgi:hypothetical protein